MKGASPRHSLLHDMVEESTCQKKKISCSHWPCNVSHLPKPRGGHSIVKLKTTCEQSLLPLYYIPQIISNFMIFFSIYTYPLIISFFIFLDFLVIFIFLVIFFGSILRHSSQKRYVFQKKIFIKFGYQFLLCNRYHVYVLINFLIKF